MTPVSLVDAEDPFTFGGKAAQLCAAVRARLPVPEGFALGYDLVEAVALGDAAALRSVADWRESLSGPVAVRSSAIGEDGVTASFAGQHLTFLNVPDVAKATADVWRSAFSDSAVAYRKRTGIDAPVRMGVVVQRLVPADVAGVMFTHNPISRADEIVLEASWGLGEAVVQGLVVPDFVRLSRDGSLLERRNGLKSLAVRQRPEGDTEHVVLSSSDAGAACLADMHLRALVALAATCDAAFGRVPHDIEWAFAGDSLYLLQRRPVTAVAA